MDIRERIYGAFLKAGIAQTIPSLLSIGGILLVLAAITSITFWGIYSTGRMRQPDGEEWLFLLGSYAAGLFFISGLVGFLWASYQFILAHRRQEQHHLERGMQALNWGWFVLAVFTAGMMAMFVFAVIFNWV